MSGDSLNNDDDFLDDPSNEEDFVIEDIVGKNDDLEDLFETPAGPEQAERPEQAEGPEQANGDGPGPAESAEPKDLEQAAADAEDELLFTDHTEGITPSEEFAKPQFAESGETDWQGDNLDLESVGVPASSMEDEEQLADPQIDEAKESFAAELDSLLEDEQDFGLDVEDELELVDRSNEVDDGISEFEQSGPFVIDDGEGLWSEDDEQEAPSVEAPLADAADTAIPDALEPAAAQAQASDAVVPGEDRPVEVVDMAEHLANSGLAGGLAGVEGTEEFELGTNLAAEDGEEAGWEPLPTQSVDDLSEVGEVQRAEEGDGEEAGEYFEGAAYGELAEGALAEGDEEDYDESGYEEDEVYQDELAETEAVPAGTSWSNQPEDLDDVDGHDIYAEDDVGSRRDYVVGAPTSNRRGLGSVLLSLAATLLIVLGVGAVVVRPEWFGLRVDPERVVKVEIARPQVDLSIDEPPAVVAAADGAMQPAQVKDPEAKGPGAKAPEDGNPEGGSPEAGNPEAGNPDSGNPDSGNPKAGATSTPDTQTQPKDPDTANPETANSETTNPVEVGSNAKPDAVEKPGTPEAGVLAAGAPDAGTPDGGTPANNTPDNNNPDDGGVAKGSVSEQAGTENGGVSTQPKDPEAVVAQQGDPQDTNQEGAAPTASDNPGAEAWPVASTTPDTPLPSEDKNSELTRFGNGLLVGDLSAKKGQAGTVNGVMPGSRAFAQLHNGNYFIGQVKQVADTTITLRVEAGEVTLATIDIAQLTPLGSADYDQLQKATKGFVRLTNNNRLVGGILSRIADDHVVLEFRSNRVMLPKSAIGEIVSDDQDQSKVRLDTTTEEDSWLREMVGRKLGTGKGGSSQASEPPSSGGRVQPSPGGGQR